MQNTITNIDKQRFTPFTVGFDDLFDRLFDMEVNTTSGYPPYNIIKLDDEEFSNISLNSKDYISKTFSRYQMVQSYVDLYEQQSI